MIYLIDGPDGAGKSTLIEQLTEQHPGALVKHYGAPVKGEDQFARYYDPIASNPGKIIIYDRCWISEFVYGPVMRNVHELTILQSLALEDAVREHGGGIVVYLTAPIDVLWERCQARGETYIETINQLESIRCLYEDVMKTLPTLPVLRVDTSR